MMWGRSASQELVVNDVPPSLVVVSLPPPPKMPSRSTVPSDARSRAGLGLRGLALDVDVDAELVLVLLVLASVPLRRSFHALAAGVAAALQLHGTQRRHPHAVWCLRPF